jgi:hypothetical protein
MTTSAQTKPSITKAEVRQALKNLLPFSVNKIGETVMDTIITGLILGVTLAWLATVQTQPVTNGELTAYIITAFVLYLLLRIVHDFDDFAQTNEIGETLMELQEQVTELHRIVKNESIVINTEDLEPRLQSLK